jgi:hypothetical protein
MFKQMLNTIQNDKIFNLKIKLITNMFTHSHMQNLIPT